MRNTREMLNTHPQTVHQLDAIAACIESCGDCVQSCITCADACLGEDMVEELRRCIRLNLDCADVCAATVRLLSRPGERVQAILRAQVESSRQAARLCADECARHAEMHEHCRICADVCRRCEAACETLLAAPGEA